MTLLQNNAMCYIMWSCKQAWICSCGVFYNLKKITITFIKKKKKRKKSHISRMQKKMHAS